jgi:hypothetical protein
VHVVGAAPSATFTRPAARSIAGQAARNAVPGLAEQFVLYTAITGTGADRATIEVQSITGGSRKVLVSGGSFGRHLTSFELSVW